MIVDFNMIRGMEKRKVSECIKTVSKLRLYLCIKLSSTLNKKAKKNICVLE